MNTYYDTNLMCFLMFKLITRTIIGSEIQCLKWPQQAVRGLGTYQYLANNCDKLGRSSLVYIEDGRTLNEFNFELMKSF